MAPVGDEDICRFDVSMDDALRMGGMQTVDNFDSYTEQMFKLHGPTRDGVFQSIAVQTFHGDETSSIVLANLVYGADIRMVQRGCGTRLATEALKSLWVFGKVVGEEFQGHEPAKLGVLGFVNHTHPPTADL